MPLYNLPFGLDSASGIHTSGGVDNDPSAPPSDDEIERRLASVGQLPEQIAAGIKPVTLPPVASTAPAAPPVPGMGAPASFAAPTPKASPAPAPFDPSATNTAPASSFADPSSGLGQMPALPKAPSYAPPASPDLTGGNGFGGVPQQPAAPKPTEILGMENYDGTDESLQTPQHQARAAQVLSGDTSPMPAGAATPPGPGSPGSPNPLATAPGTSAPGQTGQPQSKGYSVDADGKLSFDPENTTAGVARAIQDGVLDPANAKAALDLAKQVEDQHAQLVQLAGGAPQAKAVIAGLAPGLGFMGAGAAAAGAGNLTGINAGLSALTGPAAPLTAAVLNGAEFIGGGILGARATRALQEKAGDYSSTVASLNAAAKLNPGWEAAGELIPALPSAIGSIGNLAKVGAIAADGLGAGATTGAKALAATQAIAWPVLGAAAGGAATEGILRPVVETGINAGANALGIKTDPVQAPTLSSVLQMAALGGITVGHHGDFANITPNQMADVLARGQAHEDIGVPLGKPVSVDQMAAQYGDHPSGNNQAFAPLGQPLSAAEQVLYSKAKARVDQLAQNGIVDPKSLPISARQATLGGRPLATALDAGPGDSGLTPRVTFPTDSSPSAAGQSSGTLDSGIASPKSPSPSGSAASAPGGYPGSQENPASSGPAAIPNEPSPTATGAPPAGQASTAPVPGDEPTVTRQGGMSTIAHRGTTLTVPVSQEAAAVDVMKRGAGEQPAGPSPASDQPASSTEPNPPPPGSPPQLSPRPGTGDETAPPSKSLPPSDVPDPSSTGEPVSRAGSASESSAQPSGNESTAPHPFQGLADAVNAGAASQADSERPTPAFQVLGRLQRAGVEVTPDLAADVSSKADAIVAHPEMSYQEKQDALRGLIRSNIPSEPHQDSALVPPGSDARPARPATESAPAQPPAPAVPVERQPVTAGGKEAQRILARLQNLQDQGVELNGGQREARRNAELLHARDLNEQVLGKNAPPTSEAGQRAQQRLADLAPHLATMNPGQQVELHGLRMAVENDRTAQRQAIDARQAQTPTAGGMDTPAPTFKPRQQVIYQGRVGAVVSIDGDRAVVRVKAGPDPKTGVNLVAKQYRNVPLSALKEKPGTVAPSEPPAEPIQVGKATSTAQRQIAANRDMLNGLGVRKVEYGPTKAASGVEIGEDGTLRVAPSKLAVSMTKVRDIQARQGIAGTPEDWFSQVLAHEGIHAADIAVAHAKGQTIQERYNALPDAAMPQGWQAAARKIYGSEFDNLAPWQQKAEFVRQIVEGKWTGKITEQLYKHIQEAIDYLKSVAGFEGTDPRFKAHVADVEDVLRRAGAKFDGVPSEDSAPSPQGSSTAPRSFKMPTAPAGYHDVLDHIAEQGGMVSPARARKLPTYSKYQGDYDGAPTLGGYYGHAVYGGKMMPDQMAETLHQEYGVGDGSVDGMWKAIQQARETRDSVRGQKASVATQQKQADNFDRDAAEQATAKGTQTVNTSDLNVGDKVQVGNQTLTVKAVDPDTLDVTLEDHSKYGVQRVADGTALYVEKVEPGAGGDTLAASRPDRDTASMFPEDEPFDLRGEALPDAERVAAARGQANRPPARPDARVTAPTLRQGEKGTGDLFQGADQPFNLAGETAIDHGARQEAQARAVRDTAQAQAIQGRAQGDLFKAPAATAERVPRQTYPPDLLAGVDPGGRRADLLRENYANGDLSKSQETGVWSRGPRTARTARELVTPFSERTLAERRAILDKDKAQLRQSYADAGQPAPENLLAQREATLSAREQATARFQAPESKTLAAAVPEEENAPRELRETRVPVPQSVFDRMGVPRANVFADYAALMRKHPEYFASSQAAKAYVEHVMEAPTDILPGAEPDHRLIVRTNGGNKSVALEVELRGGKYRVRSAHTLTDQQLAAKRIAAGPGATLGVSRVDPEAGQETPSRSLGTSRGVPPVGEGQTTMPTDGGQSSRRGSTQVTLSPQDARPIQNYVRAIPDRLLYSERDAQGKEQYGRELQPHVTSLYGLTGEGDTPEAVRAAVAGHGSVKFKLGKLSTFSNPDAPYDVLKADVDSPDLHALNAKLRSLPHQSDYPDYQPHMTLAYLKKGAAENYVGKNPFQNRELTATSLTHSPADAAQGRSEISLTGSSGGILSAAVPERESTTHEGVVGDKLDARRTAFSADSGTLGIPRDQMPQVAAEHRGAMARFLNARGMQVSEADVLPGDLKPSQAEFNPGKVAKAGAIREAGDATPRRILYSNDGHVIDGHHQWLDRLQNTPDEAMPALKIDAPAHEILSQIHEFPSAGMEKAPDIAPRIVSAAQPGDTPNMAKAREWLADQRQAGNNPTPNDIARATKTGADRAQRIIADQDEAERQANSPIFGAAAPGDEEDPLSEQAAAPAPRKQGSFLQRTRNEIARARTQMAADDHIASHFDAAETMAGESKDQAASGVRLDIKNDLDRNAAGAVVEAGYDRNQLAADLAKVKASPDQKLAKEYAPVYQHGLDNFDRLRDAAEGWRQRELAEDAAREAAGLAPSSEARMRHINDDPLSPESTIAPDHGFGATKGFRTQADAISAGVDPKTTDLADLAGKKIYDSRRQINQKAFHDELTSMKAADGKPIIGGMVETSERLRPDGTPTVEQKVPKGYEAVQAGNNLLTVHKDYAPLVRALYDPSAIQAHPLGRAVLKGVAIAKHYTLLADTFHVARLFFKELTHGGGIGYGKGSSILEYSDADLDRAVSSGDLTKEEAAFARKNRPAAQELIGAGFNVGKMGDNLAEAAHLHLPGIGKFNDWVFKKFSRGAMLQTALAGLERNLKRYQPEMDAGKLSRADVVRQTAKEYNEVFGNLGHQGLFKSATMQDAARLAFLAPNWTESQLRSEVRGLDQMGKTVTDAATGKGLRVGNVAQGMAAGIVGLVAANQIVNLATRGKPTWDNPEDGHKFDAWLPGGPHGRGFFFGPMELTAEFSHAMMKYMGGGDNAVDAATHIASNKLSGLGRAVKDLATGTDYKGQPYGSMGERLKAAAVDALPSPLPLGAFLQKDPKGPLGYGLNHEKGSVEKQAFGMAGMKLENAPSARNQVYAMADRFKATPEGAKATGGKGAAAAGGQAARPPSAYGDLRHYLDNEDAGAAQGEIQRLVTEGGKSLPQIGKALGIEADGKLHPERFTGSLEGDRAMVQQFTPAQKQLYVQAFKDRAANAQLFAHIISSMPGDQKEALRLASAMNTKGNKSGAAQVGKSSVLQPGQPKPSVPSQPAAPAPPRPSLSSRL